MRRGFVGLCAREYDGTDPRLCFGVGSRCRSARQVSDLITPGGVPRSRQFTLSCFYRTIDESLVLIAYGRKLRLKRFADHTRRQKQRLIDIPGAKMPAHSPRLNQTR